MQSVTFNGQASRVVIGPGSLAHLGREIEALGARRALVLSTPGQADQAQGRGAPVALEDTGMKPSDLDRAAGIAVRNPYVNPRLIHKDRIGEIRQLLQGLGRMGDPWPID